MPRPARARIRLGVLLVAATVAVGACGARTFVRPSGPAAPAPDAAHAWAEASRHCGAVESYAGALGLTGRVGAQRIRGLASATLDVAIDRRDRVAIEARVGGQIVFRLGGAAERAVLWLSEGNRVATAGAADLLGALVGAGLAPGRLREVLAGCPAASARVAHAGRYGDVLEVELDRFGTVFLQQAGGAWRVRAWMFDGWDVGYDRLMPEGMPERLTIRSRADMSPAVSLSLRVHRAETNVDVPEPVFAVAVPDGAQETTLDDLRAAGPLGQQ